MTDKEIVEPKVLFCKRCRAPKVEGREYCCYCVGRYELKRRSFRTRMAYRLLPPQTKSWFVFHLGYERQYEQLIPEHLWATEWLDIEEINRPLEVDEE